MKPDASLLENNVEQESKGGSVHYLENFSEAPEPSTTLGALGKKTYDDWCRALINQGLLTITSIEFVEMLARAKDAVAYYADQKKPAPRHVNEAVRAAMMKLEKLDADTTIQANLQGGKSKYHTFGFARRVQQKRHDS